MTAPVHSIGADSSLEDADRAIRANKVSALSVVEDGRLCGVLSRTDLLKLGEYDYGETFHLPDGIVRQAMSKPALSVTPEAPLSEAARSMRKHHYHRVFVTEEEKPTGVLSTRDLMRAVADARVKTPIGDLATTSVVMVKDDDPLALAVDRLDRSNKQGLVVVHNRWPVGSFRQADALIARARDGNTPVQEVMDLRILTLPESIPVYRAALQALEMGVRRILTVGDGVKGIVSGLDFARVVSEQAN